LFFLCDGKSSISAIAHELQIDEDTLKKIANTLVEKGVMIIV